MYPHYTQEVCGASPFIGIMLDRLPRKVLLQADNLCLGTIWVLLALLSRWHMLSLPLLILLVTVSGALTPIAYLGRMMVLPNLVSGDLWQSANTWMQLNMNLVILLGPALGGFLIAAIGAEFTVVVGGTLCVVLGVAAYLRPVWWSEQPPGSYGARRPPIKG